MLTYLHITKPMLIVVMVSAALRRANLNTQHLTAAAIMLSAALRHANLSTHH